MGPVGEGFGTALIIIIIICGGLFYGVIRGVEWMVSDESIRTKAPITPDLELVIENGKIDTVYVYKMKP